ncbi:hypothetical protein, partial [Pyruvatibacter sp.]
YFEKKKGDTFVMFSYSGCHLIFSPQKNRLFNQLCCFPLLTAKKPIVFKERGKRETIEKSPKEKKREKQ